MPDAQRTLVKSPPELWAEISDAESLTRHLGELGEIRITRLDPETTVAWEGDRVRGTVELEASGWGTKVTLTAQETAPELPDVVVEEVAEPVAAPARAAAPLPPSSRRPGLLTLFRRRPRGQTPLGVPAQSARVPAQGVRVPTQSAHRSAQGDHSSTQRGQTPVRVPARFDVEAVLVGVLDELGSASRRPFSR